MLVNLFQRDIALRQGGYFSHLKYLALTIKITHHPPHRDIDKV